MVPSSDFLEARTIKREILAELRESWLLNKPSTPEDLLARWPGNPQGDDDIAALLFEDFCRRIENGDHVSEQDYEQRFPEHGPSFVKLKQRQDFFRAVGAKNDTLALPSTGDELFGFRLDSALGQGAFARVFLARQTGLAGRPVVLKVSTIVGDEPQTLAQLQHTHIVPIYSLHENTQAGLRAVCMPYFGGATLGEILSAAWAANNRPTRGEQIVSALARVQAPQIGPDEPTESGLSILNGLSYDRAAAWIAARLAEALEHAHQRGVLHRDIKPSNILLSSDGQPMLLDFNLASNAQENQAQATLGGTVAYMAPEHLRALISGNQAAAKQVDQRSDVYALGMVLFEMLAGRGPFEHKASYSPLREVVAAMAEERGQTAPSLRLAGIAVPWSLESIVRRCLAPDPARRYQSAGELTEDLKRFLEDRPLRHAPELSLKERLGKWLRRHPRLTSSGTVVAASFFMLIAIGVIFFGVRERLHAAQARERRQSFEASTVRALWYLNTTAEIHDHLAQGLDENEAALDQYGVLDRDDWQQHPDWRRLDGDVRQRLAEDVCELLVLRAWARVCGAPAKREVLREALALLDRAEAIEGLPPLQALWRDRAMYLEKLGETEQAKQAANRALRLQPASALDHYLLATSLARKGKPGYARAVAELDRALLLNPRHYWSLLQRGICHQELGEHHRAAGEHLLAAGEHLLAVADFSTCIGLWPDFAWGYFNRGCALDQSGKRTQALADYSAALERDPDFVLAYVNRGLARFEERQFAAALSDFDAARARGHDDARLHSGRGVALEGLRRHRDADQAFALAAARLAAVAPAQRSRLRWVYGFAVNERLPAAAREAFEAVLADDPKQPQALYGLAMLDARQGETTRALEHFDRALEADPNFIDARRFRAVLRARIGEIARAQQDIEFCLEREPASGVTLYNAACVYALISKHSENAGELRRHALAHLKHAFHAGYGQDKAATDTDLANLRGDQVFQRLLNESAKQ